MNGGANVPAGVPMRLEFDRRRAESLRLRGDASCGRDWFRECPMLLGDSGSDNEVETSVDFGRAREGGGPAEGEVEEFRVKGLGRHRGPLGAGALMASVLCRGGRRENALPGAAHHAAGVEKELKL